MMAKAEKLGKKLLLPIDTTIAAGFPDPIDAEIEVKVVDSDKILLTWKVLTSAQRHRNSLPTL